MHALTPTNLALDVLVLASLGTLAVNACEPGVSGAPLHHPVGLT